MERFRLHILSFFFCLATVIVGCSQSPANREFYALDELIDKDPRQGLIVVDSILSHLNVIDRHRQMEYSLLKYKAEDKCYVERQSDSTIVALFDYFQKHGSTYQQLLSYYYMGGTYRDMGDYPLSIVWYDKAEEFAMSHTLTRRDSMLLWSISVERYCAAGMPHLLLRCYVSEMRWASMLSLRKTEAFSLNFWLDSVVKNWHLAPLVSRWSMSEWRFR